jgi:nucleoside-diphosphate-sugar epimerase
MTESATTRRHGRKAGERELGRVLVTGAGGFLGTAIVTELQAMNVDVVASDIGPVALVCAGMIHCEVTDFNQVGAVVEGGGFTTILHCGAVSGPMVMPDRPLDIWRINAGGTANILEVARRHGVGRIIVCSTSEVYGNQSGRVDETTPPLTSTVYGASKLAGEQAMMGYVHDHGLDAIALRLSWIYGPGRQTPTMLDRLIRTTLRGENSSLAIPADTYTHYLHIHDAVQGTLAAATAEKADARIFNITSGRGIVMSDVVGIITDLYPDVTVTCAQPDPVARGISKIANGLAKRDIGFKPLVPLSEGLAALCRALQHEREGRPPA